MNVTCFGERHGQHKLTTQQVHEIRASKKYATALSKIYNVNKRTIQRIQSYEARQHE